MNAGNLGQTSDSTIVFYDVVTGKPLFEAPKGRSWSEFNEARVRSFSRRKHSMFRFTIAVKESKKHGWPSFRDEEVNQEYVRILPDGEAVSIDGTHLGHNLPDASGNRCSADYDACDVISLIGYCINVVSVAAMPP